MNANATGQISSPPITILRQPPAVPVSAPITKPLPALPKSSPEKNKEDTTASEPPPPPPPQPPVRTRSTLKAQPNGNNNIVSNNNNGNGSNSKNQLTDASNEVAKLVYKTVMMGSVQNVSEIVDNEKSPSRKKSVRCFQFSLTLLVQYQSDISSKKGCGRTDITW